MEKINWTLDDYKVVNFVAIGNGLWLGFLLWLVLSVWLDVTGFLQCWLGATVFSWIVAIIRQARVIESRGYSEDEIQD